MKFTWKKENRWIEVETNPEPERIVKIFTSITWDTIDARVLGSSTAGWLGLTSEISWDGRQDRYYCP